MFYIIEKEEQLKELDKQKDCFIRFISYSNNFHPALTRLSLIYLRPLDSHKGYILCLNHNESLSLDQNLVFEWLNNNTKKLFVLDKKQALYYYNKPEQLYDINFIKQVNIDITNTCINYYYNKHTNLSNVNCLIPISKHYEESELIYNNIVDIINQFDLMFEESLNIFNFNNINTTNVFYQIEKNGLKLDKNAFIKHYSTSLIYPEFNLYRSKALTKYNLNTLTSRPSNSFNNINFAALNKDTNERECYIPENNLFVELDFQGYHPRLITELIGFDFPKNKNTYDVLGELLNVTKDKAKELTFKQIYGGVWNEYQNKPFFKDIVTYVDEMWDEFQYNGRIATKNKIFYKKELPNITPYKLFNYIIQSKETSTNVELLEELLYYLKDKNTKIVLYTYDAILLDYDKNEKILQDIIKILKYPVNIKKGTTYNNLTTI